MQEARAETRATYRAANRKAAEQAFRRFPAERRKGIPVNGSRRFERDLPAFLAKNQRNSQAAF
jgi:hypothetical protein